MTTFLYIQFVTLYKSSWLFTTANYQIAQTNLSVIRQKGKSQKGGIKKTKHPKFSKKQTFPIPWYPSPFEDSPFCFITD